MGSEKNGTSWREKPCEMGGFGGEPLPQSIPEVLVFLWLLTRAVRDTKTLRACLSLFFPEKLLQEAPFGSDCYFRERSPPSSWVKSLCGSPWGSDSSFWRRLTADSARAHDVVPSSERFLPHSGPVRRRVRALPTTHARLLQRQNVQESQPANAPQWVGQDDIFSRCVSLSAIPSSLSGNGSQVQSASHLVGHPRSMYSTTGNKIKMDASR